MSFLKVSNYKIKIFTCMRFCLITVAHKLKWVIFWSKHMLGYGNSCEYQMKKMNIT